MAGNNLPPKPWERSETSSSPSPFKPPSSGNTSDVVEASGTAKPGEIVSKTETNTPINTTNALGRPVPTRPWMQTYGGNYGGYGSMNYGSSYGSGMYNTYGSVVGGYGGLYGNRMYGGGYGGLYGGSGMYGGGPVGSYGMGMNGPYGNFDPNNPQGPPSPPGFWMSLVRVMHGIVDFFNRILMLIDQNTHAFHLLMSALLQLFDRSGLLYGEIARFVLRILGRRRPRKNLQQGPSGSWESVWGDGNK